MTRNRSIKIRHLALVALLLFSGACILEFEEGIFHSVSLHFALSESLPEGETTLVHSLHYPFEVKLKKKWVRVSGALMAPEQKEEDEEGEGEGEEKKQLPTEIVLETLFVENTDDGGDDGDSDGGKRIDRKKVTAEIGDDGAFSASVKMRKNLPADALQMIFLEPRDADLLEGTKIWLCVDVVDKKKDLRSLPDCATGDEDGGPEPQPGTLTVEVLDNAFDPKRIQVQPGNTVRWTLTGLNLNHTVTAMDESIFDSGFLTTPGAFFEVTFTEAQNNQTFEYFCRTHRSCCEMQGSVQVGINAPEPGDGY